MKIAVISDTHGNYPLAVRALELAGAVDHVIHLGDHIEDAQLIGDIMERNVVMVAGNCDIGSSAPRETVMNLGGRRFFISHGDRYGVKGGLGRLRAKAGEERAGIALYGHTHIPSVAEIDGVLCVNPGSLQKTAERASFALLTIDRGTVKAEIIAVNCES